MPTLKKENQKYFDEVLLTFYSNRPENSPTILQVSPYSRALAISYTTLFG